MHQQRRNRSRGVPDVDGGMKDETNPVDDGLGRYWMCFIPEVENGFHLNS